VPVSITKLHSFFKTSTSGTEVKTLHITYYNEMATHYILVRPNFSECICLSFLDWYSSTCDSL